MKKSTLFILLLLIQLLNAQKITTKKGIINFEASVPLFEAVEAVNQKGQISLDTQSKVFVCVANIVDFNFRINLMKTHFNENYMESKRYPKAIFKGKIGKFDLKNVDEVAKEYIIKGKIQIRGKTKEISVIAILKKVGNGIEINSNFLLNTDDFNIEIPSIVAGKVSKEVNTHFLAVLN